MKEFLKDLLAIIGIIYPVYVFISYLKVEDSSTFDIGSIILIIIFASSINYFYKKYQT